MTAFYVSFSTVGFTCKVKIMGGEGNPLLFEQLFRVFLFLLRLVQVFTSKTFGRQCGIYPEHFQTWHISVAKVHDHSAGLISFVCNLVLFTSHRLFFSFCIILNVLCINYLLFLEPKLGWLTYNPMISSWECYVYCSPTLTSPWWYFARCGDKLHAAAFLCIFVPFKSFSFFLLACPSTPSFILLTIPLLSTLPSDVKGIKCFGFAVPYGDFPPVPNQRSLLCLTAHL